MKKQQMDKQPLDYSLTKAILDILLDMGENLTLFESPYTRMKRSWRKLSGAPEKQFKWWRYRRAMKYLQKMGEVESVTDNDQIFIKLTKDGTVKALLSRLSKNFSKKPVWDAKWRVIIWDIPEDSRQDRNRIRALVKSLGFYQLQKSVFVTPYPLPGSAVHYLRETELLKYIRFLRADKIDDDKYLKKHFGLPQN